MDEKKRAMAAVRCLQQQGYEAYLVGGCVRDTLRHAQPDDYDICTSALPQQVRAAFDGWPVIDTGMAHGTVTVVYEHMRLEVTTYRVDGAYSDGRHPDKVIFTPSLTEDLRRRDFTINAMAMDEAKIFDPFGGQQDLQNGILRCVGEPDQRFLEDGLRIMRALRFSAVLGYDIEQKTAESLLKNKALLDRIARERVREELNKLLVGKNAGQVLRRYREVIAQVLPEIREMFDHPQYHAYHKYDVWEHTVQAVEHSAPLLPVRLALLMHDSGKPATFTRDAEGIGHFYAHAKVSTELTRAVMHRLRYDNELTGRVIHLVEHHDAVLNPTEKAVRRQLNRWGQEGFFLLLEVKRGDVRGQGMMQERLGELDEIQRVCEVVLAQKQCFCLKDLAVDGRDVIACGITQGKEIGAALQTLLELVLQDNTRNERGYLLAQLEKRKEQHGN